jgi:hypothetical protein
VVLDKFLEFFPDGELWLPEVLGDFEDFDFGFFLKFSTTPSSRFFSADPDLCSDLSLP